MATVTEFIKTQDHPMVISGISTIDINETASLGIPCGGRAIVRLGFPSTFTGTTVTFTVQDFPSTTLRNLDGSTTTITVPFRPLYDGAGNLVTVTATDDSVIDVPELSGVFAFKIVSGSSEAAARRIEVQCVGPYPTSPGINSVELEPGATVTANQGTAAAASGAWPVYEPALATTAIASTVYSPPTSVVTAAFLKASAGNVFKFYATNANAAVRYFQLHNKATIPLATEVPQLVVPIPAGTVNNPGWVEIDMKYADPFTVGIGFAISTTQGTFTDGSTAGEHIKIVEYA